MIICIFCLTNSWSNRRDKSFSRSSSRRYCSSGSEVSGEIGLWEGTEIRCRSLSYSLSGFKYTSYSRKSSLE